MEKTPTVCDACGSKKHPLLPNCIDCMWNLYFLEEEVKRKLARRVAHRTGKSATSAALLEGIDIYSGVV